MRILVIGGTGTISAHTTAALQAAGHEVTLLNRGIRASAADNTARLSGDRRDPAVLRHAIDLARPETVVDFVCFTPEEAAVVLEIGTGRIGHLVFVSTVDALGFPQEVPIPENAARRPGVGDYAIAKQACEDVLLGQDALPVTVARPTYSMSDRFVISLFDHRCVSLMQRLARGLPVVLPDGGRHLIHPSDARDTGRMIADMAGAEQAFGRTYTAGSRDVAMSHRAYVELVAATLGVYTIDSVEVPMSDIDAMQLAEAENSVFSNVTRFDLDFTFERFARDFPGFRWQTDLRRPIADYVARIRAEGWMDKPVVHDLETAILARWRQ